MTFIISAVGNDTAFQVSDRLASVPLGGTYRPVDPLTNKNVIFSARDALVSVGISGLAHIEGIPADRWVAQALIGDELTEHGAIELVVGGPPRDDIWTSTQRLRTRLEHVFGAQRRPARQSLAIVGWQRRRRNEARPILWRVENSPSAPGDFVLLNLLPGARRWRRGLAFTGTGMPLRPPLQALLRSMEGHPSTRGQFDARMVATIRDVAEVYPGVGTSCMSIWIHPSAWPNVVIRYDHGASPATFQTRTSEGRELVLPVAFTPWVIGQGAHLAPNVMMGAGGVCEVGGVSCRIMLPDSQDARDFGLWMDRMPRDWRRGSSLAS